MNYAKLLILILLTAILPGCRDDSPGNGLIITGPVLSGKELGTDRKAEQLQMIKALKGEELRDYIATQKQTEKWDGVGPFKKGVRYDVSGDQQKKAQAMNDGYIKMYKVLKKSMEEAKAREVSRQAKEKSDKNS